MRIDPPALSQIPALRELWQEAFGDSEEFLNGFFALGFSARRCRCVLEGAPVAAVYWFDCFRGDDRFAYLYALAVKGAHRHQGLARALLTDTLTHLKGQGYAGALLAPATETLGESYRRMGFSHAVNVRCWESAAGENPIVLTALTPAEYFRRRVAFLPGDGLQIGSESWDFAGSQYTFYGGTDFLVAVQKNAPDFYAPELLGDKTAAPGILRALGAASGSFRTPGEGAPAALCAMLGQPPPPRYFALDFG